MILRTAMTVKMHVTPAIVIVVMEMPSFSKQLHPEQNAKRDEHQSHDAFSGHRHRFRDRHTEHKNNCAYE